MHSTMLIVDSSTPRKSMLEALLPIYINHFDCFLLVFAFAFAQQVQNMPFIYSQILVTSFDTRNLIKILYQCDTESIADREMIMNINMFPIGR